MNEEQSVRLYQDSDTGYYMERVGKDGNNYIATESAETGPDNQALNGFFPYNTAYGEHQNVKNPVRVGNLGVNYLFGTHFTIPFTLPEGNELVMDKNDKESRSRLLLSFQAMMIPGSILTISLYLIWVVSMTGVREPLILRIKHGKLKTGTMGI